MPSLLKSRFVQWLSTPLRRHLGAHTTRIVTVHTDPTRSQLGQLTSEVAVLSRRNHVQATNLAGSIRLSEDTRAQLIAVGEELATIREELATIRVELADIRSHDDRV